MTPTISGTSLIRSLTRTLLVWPLLGLAITLGSPLDAQADPCEVVDNGTGTVTLPPDGCDYLSPDEVHLIIDGLPPDTTIEFAPIHKDFVCSQADPNGGLCSVPISPGLCEAAGGSLGGNADCFDSTLEFEVTGTGALAGFSRLISIPAITEIHTGPRNAGDPVQTFPTEMISLQADLFGDPDFALLQIRAGSSFGLPSPGETTLTLQTNGNFQVDSFFDVTYTIDFQGAGGSILEGFAGTTTATLRMEANVNPCEVVDNGSGTVTLPPAGCEYLSPDEVHEILDDLPAGTTIELAAIHKDFICGQGGPAAACSVVLPGGECEAPGGGLGGNVDCFNSTVEFTLIGTGALAGFQRTLTLIAETEIHTGPRNPGDAVQDFDTEMVQLSAELFGDPDFDLLRIEAGSNFGLPSPGHTTLTRRANGNFQVDSFFDVTYTIEFQGAPGGQLDGLSGTTQGTLQMTTGAPPAPAVAVPVFGKLTFALLAGLLAAVSLFAALRRRARA